MRSAVSKSTAYGWAVAAGLLGSASLLFFWVFLVLGPLDVIDLKLGNRGALTLDLALSLAFFVQHSVMVRPWFGKRMERIVSPRLHGAVYAVASSLLLFALVGLLFLFVW